MDKNLLSALLVGIMAMLALVLVLSLFGATATRMGRRSTALFAGAGGILVTLYLSANPAVLTEVTSYVVAAVLALLLAFLYALRRRL